MSWLWIHARDQRAARLITQGSSKVRELSAARNVSRSGSSANDGCKLTPLAASAVHAAKARPNN